MSRRYDPTTNVGQNWRVTLQGPLDIRTVMGTTSDLLSKAAFGGVGQQDLRYQGMMVVVVEDTPVNNGVYYLKDDPNEVSITASSWVKLLGLPDDSGAGEGDDYVLEYVDGNFEWKRKTIPQNLSDLSDVSIDSASDGDYLRYRNGQWVNESGDGGGGSIVTYTQTYPSTGAVEIGRITIDGNETIIYGATGGSGGGVTTEAISYKKIFDPVSQGGLGYTEQGTAGTGFGFLKSDSFPGGNYTIPAGTAYDTIFKKIFDGTNVSISAQNKSLTYNSQDQYYTTANITVTPTSAAIYYSTTQNGTYAAYDSSSYMHAKNVGDTATLWFKSKSGDTWSSAVQATLSISKKPITVNPTASTTTIYVGQSITIGYDLSPSMYGTDSSSVNVSSYYLGNSSSASSGISVTSGSIINDAGTFYLKANVSNLNNQSSLPLKNYSFTSGNVQVIVKPRIRYKTWLDLAYHNPFTQVTQYQDSPYDQAFTSYQGMTTTGLTSDYYMVPFTHKQTIQFKLRIGKPYMLDTNDMLYYETAESKWKNKVDEQFNCFGTPQSVTDGGIEYWEYTYNAPNTTAPIAIKVTK